MKIDAKQIFDGIKKGNIAYLSKAMTIVESNSAKNQKIALELLDLCDKNKNKSIRIGISGMPGAGKSTFIERLGLEYIKLGKKVAVLAIDPSSTITGGSILGDKTRMDNLAISDKAFIRPSPNSGSLGGVSKKTRDLITVCEAADYDYVIIETVGIGQSEVEVKSLTDLFTLLILPGGGDDLQGIKKGAVELADLVVINKADGENKKLAAITKSDYQLAGRILSTHSENFQSNVLTCSALTGYNFNLVTEAINQFINESIKSGDFEQNRKMQNEKWLNKSIQNALYENFMAKEENKVTLNNIKSAMIDGEISFYKALSTIINKL
ncbi:methylmalonyl Co-A mutase-associated GTPase MeaB [Candidatus Kapabacteria bacterium]|nr:methylmalonyl Co-A mutase-associated GTPase MeaB [Candidatus Kapabacteria bacterium]